MPPVVAIHSVAKLFGTHAVLRSISCELHAGQGYLIVGENGAGKSTLLRIVAGLASASSGTVSVFGSQPGEVRERIGYMSHETMLYEELTAAENLRYYAKLYPDRNCLAPEQALHAVGLDPVLQLHVSKYSQGMRQRASLARALMTQPALLLLDEPFSHVDRASANRMVELLHELRESGCTLVLTTHQPELARPLAGTTWQLRGGMLVEAA